MVQEGHMKYDCTGASLENRWYRRVTREYMGQEGHWWIDGTGASLGDR